MVRRNSREGGIVQGVKSDTVGHPPLKGQQALACLPGKCVTSCRESASV